MNRRTFLWCGGLAGITGLAGCSTTSDAVRGGVVLTRVELGNGTSTAQLFDVQVLHDDEIIHWSSCEVGVGDDGEEMGGRVIEIDSPDTPGSVTVYVRVGEKWTGLDFDDYDEYDSERVIAVVTYGMIEDELRVRPHVSDRPASDAI